MQSRDYAGAASMLTDDALKTAADPAYGRYLRALARLRSKEHAAAISDCDAVPAQSAWFRKAVFLKAQCLIELNRHREAEQIFSAEAARLFSTARKEKLAGVLADFAAEITRPLLPGEPPSYANRVKAIELYTSALEIETGQVMREDLMHRRAVVIRDAGHAQDLDAACAAYLNEFDPDWTSMIGSVERSRGQKNAKASAGAHRWEMRMMLAEHTLAQGRREWARQYAADILELWKKQPPAAGAKPDAGDVEWLVCRTHGLVHGAQAQSRTQADVQRGVQGDVQGDVQVQANAVPQVAQSGMEALSEGDPARHIEALRAFLRNHRLHARAAEAALTLAWAIEQRGQNEEAIAAYTDFLKEPAWPAPAPDLSRADLRPAAERLADWRQDAVFQIGRLRFNLRQYPQAIAQWRDYAAKFPNGALWQQAQSRIVDAEFQLCLAPVAADDEEGARKLFEDFIAKHPLDRRAPQLLFLAGQFPFSQAQQLGKTNAPADRIRALHEKAVAEWAKLISKYPVSEEASLAMYRTGVLQTGPLGRYEDGLATFKRLTWGGWKSLAQERAAMLPQKSLALSTERVFRSNEKPSVHVSVRNIEKLRVSVFKLGLEDYFRSRHRLDGDAGIGSLDTELIQPDRTWEVPVAGYARLKEIEQDIEVPFDGAAPGVKIVRVEGDDWQSSTVVIRSDVDFIVESAWKEALIFAQNRLTNQPAADAEVLVSDGKRLIGQGRTGADGVFRLRGAAVREAANLCVYLRTPQGEAMQRLNLVGMTQEITGGDDPSGGVLTRRGHIYTDRSAYRAGETVHFRGIVRDVKDGAYFVPEGRAFTVRVTGEGKRVLHESKVKLDPFGSFAAGVRLPRGAPVGEYTITAAADEGVEKYRATFSIAEFEIPMMEASMDIQPETVFPGDVVRGTVRVRHTWGSAAKDEVVHVRMPDGRMIEGRTDAEGAFAFTQETAGFQPGMVLEFSVELPGPSIEARAAVPLRKTGIVPSWEHVPRAVVAGEPAKVRVKLLTPGGKPVAQAAKLTVLRGAVDAADPVLAGLPGLGYIATAPAPLKVAEVDVATDATTGIGEAVLKLPEGGIHQLVLEAKDARGNPATLRALLVCSGADDPVKLRVLADTGSVDEGASLAVRTHSRIAAPLALVTFAGEHILAHRVVPLKVGSNPFDVAVGDGFWPLFDVTVAFLDGRELHRARETFKVRRRLKLAITPPAGVVLPGVESEIKLRATDQRDRPVRAQFSLALASKALFAEFPDESAAMAEFFAEGARSGSSYRFGSSAVFRHRARSLQMQPTKGGRPAQAVAVLSHVERARQLEEREAEAYRRGGQTIVFDSSLAPGIASLVGAGTDPTFQQVLRVLDQNGGTLVLGDPAATAGNRSGSLAISANAIDALLAGTTSGAPARTQIEFGRMLSQPQIPQQFSVLVPTPPSTLGGAWHEAIGAHVQWHFPIVTDAKGNASVKLTMPAEHGAWRLAAKGCTVDTLAGAAEETIVTREKFFVELRAPAALHEGDSWQPEAVIHMLEGAEGEVKVSITLGLPGGPKHFEKAAHVGPGRAEAVLFDAVAVPRGAGELRWAAEARIAELKSSAAAVLPVTPQGFARIVNAGELPAGTVKLPLALPAGEAALTQRRIATVHFSAGDLLFDMAMQRQPSIAGLHATPQTAASSLLAAVSALRVGRAQGMPAERRTILEERIRRLIAELQLTQRDGGWPWQGVNSTDWHRDSVVTSLAVWGLRDAVALGFTASERTIEDGMKYLKSALAIIPPGEPEKSAMLLHALALGKDADFSVANRLFRDRATLNEPALAFLAGAFTRMGRDAEARELLDALARKASRPAKPGDAVHWQGSMVVSRLSQVDDITAIALWSLAKADPKSPLLPAAAAHLLRSGGVLLGAQSPVQGLHAAALAEYFLTQPMPHPAALDGALTVNGKQWRKITAGDLSGVTGLAVPPELLAGGENEVALKADAGAAKMIVHASLVAAVEKRPEESAALPQIARRSYLHDALRHRDTPLAADSTSPVAAAEHGQIVRVEIELKDPDPLYTGYLVLDEPLPAGFAFVEGLQNSNLARIEHVPSGLRLWFAPGGTGRVEYSLIALHPGVWRVPPPVLRDACRPERVRIGKEAVLTVLAPGGKSGDPYVMNRAERFELAEKLFGENDLPAARAHLDALQGDAEARKEYERDIARMLLWIHTTQPQMDARRVVELFETLSERHADLVIPYEKILRVAAAYRQIGEFERSWFVDRATIESSFVRDARVSAALRGQGDFLGGAEHLLSLWAEYPDVHDVLLAHFSLAQDIQDRAADADSMPTRSGAPKPTKTQLLTRSRELLRRHLTLHADDADADGAAFSLCNAHFDLKDYAKVAAQAEAAAAAYPKSTFLTSFQYMAALGHFWQNEFAKALAAAAPVAAGGSKDAPNARYITGQIHHAQSHPEEALAWYRKVRNEFPDAADAIAYIEERRVVLPLARTFRPGEPVKIDLATRNVKEAALRVYKVDLLKLYGRGGEITDVTKVNLAGITPEAELTVPLGDGRDFAWRHRDVALPVKGEGAYLVICRGDDITTSGIVLITPLELERRENHDDGSLRVHVRDAVKGGYVADADIRVFDSFGGEPSSGRTDPRGVFQAGGLAGHATVVVRHGDTRYAFRRTSEPLRPSVMRTARTTSAAISEKGAPAKPKSMSKEDYLLNVKQQLKGSQSGNKNLWEGKVSTGGKGVEALKALKK